MSKQELKMMDYLSIYNEIVSKGEKTESVYQYQNLSASHEYDGYTCYVSYKDVILTLLFHGKFSLQYDKKESLESFYRIAEKILRNK